MLIPRTISLAALAMLIIISKVAFGMTHVLFTVDVESFAAGNPATQIWGVFPGIKDQWGIPKIMDILEENGSRGTFYLNAYEAAKHGEDPLRSAAVEVVRRGHDLQLHTHPGPMFSVRELSRADYDLQYEILSIGKKLLQEWAGVTPIAHRAGAYSANEDSLKALLALEIPVDSSLSVASSSPLAMVGYHSNAIQNIEGIVQFPVTYYDQVRFGPWRSPRIVDIEASSFYELKSILDQAASAGLCSVNVMMHSFSLSRYGKPDFPVSEKLAKILSYISDHPKLHTATTSELYHQIREGGACQGDVDFVPHTGIVLTYLRAVEDFHKGSMNKVVSLGVPALFTCALILLGLMVRKWRTRGKQSCQ